MHLPLSKRAFHFFLPVSISAIPLSFGLLNKEAIWVSTWTLGILTTFTTYLAFLLFLQIRKVKAGDNFLIQFLVLVALGVFRGLFIYYSAPLFGLEDPSALGPRLINSAVTTLVWLGLSSILVEANRRYQRRYRAIINQVLIANMRSSDALDPSFALVARDLAKMQRRLDATYKSSQESIPNPAVASNAAREIREQIDSALRPLSQRLWLNSLYEYPKLRIYPLLLQATKNLKFPLTPLIAIYGVTTTFNYSVTFGLYKGATRALVGTLFLFIMEKVRRFLIEKYSGARIVINITYLIFIGVIINFISTLSTDDVELSAFLPYYIILAPEVGGLIIIVSAVYLAATDRTAILNSLKGQLDLTNKKLDSKYKEYTAGNMQLASYLHNSLQSELMAIATQLDLVAKEPKSGEVEKVLERLYSIVNRSMSEDLLNYLEVPEVRYRRMKTSWSGIAEISDQIDPAVFVDNARSTLFVQLIQEAISNAVRKGGAKSIEILAGYSDDVLQVVISSDGEFDPTAKAGLGDQWIERFAVSDWRIKAGGNGTVLEVDF
jgi:signal transduction histidine kinase